jgi:hypothetical protein
MDVRARRCAGRQWQLLFAAGHTRHPGSEPRHLARAERL